MKIYGFISFDRADNNLHPQFFCSELTARFEYEERRRSTHRSYGDQGVGHFESHILEWDAPDVFLLVDRYAMNYFPLRGVYRSRKEALNNSALCATPEFVIERCFINKTSRTSIEDAMTLIDSRKLQIQDDMREIQNMENLVNRFVLDVYGKKTIW